MYIWTEKKGIDGSSQLHTDLNGIQTHDLCNIGAVLSGALFSSEIDSLRGMMNQASLQESKMCCKG